MRSYELHPRNIFRLKPPIFKDLAKKYPEFRNNCYIGRGGKIVVDFKNLNVVKSLSTVLLKEYFDLEVQLPTLVPRIPQRLNYILLLEDILNLNNLNNDVLGTGSSCIFALLGAKLKKWNFCGTEIDASSIEYANNNIKKNNLEHKISIIHTYPDTIFETVLISTEKNFTFCMCNPPFFDPEESEQSFFNTNDDQFIQNYSSTTSSTIFSKRNAPRSATIAKTNEVFFKGGEAEFIHKIIKESIIYKKRIRIFTTMVAKQKNLKIIKSFLEEDSNVKYNVYTLSQGKTVRWVVAWTYDNTLELLDFASK